MANIPTLSSENFDWKGANGSTTIGRTGLRDFPASFFVKSRRTGQVKLFLHDVETMEANEFFDGEAAAYMSPGSGVSVRIWC